MYPTYRLLVKNMETSRIKLKRVEFMPKILEPGILYVAEEYGAAAHLCPCNCGTKVRTPLGPTEWELTETKYGPSLHPSVGNWQHECRSHYWIRQGRIVWSEDWSEEKEAIGRELENQRRSDYFENESRHESGFWCRLRDWVLRVIRR